MDEITELLDPGYQPKKSYTELSQAGVPNKGGLALLASAEQTANPDPSIEALKLPSSPSTSPSER
jgi:hypothetical protein